MNIEQILTQLGLESILTSGAFEGLRETLVNIMPWLLGALLLFGLVNCFSGYKYRHLWYMILCIFIGMAAGSWLYIHYTLSPTVCGAVGALAAIFAALFYKLGLCISVFCLSFYLFGLTLGIQGILLLVLCAVLAASVFLLERWVSTIVTTAVGSLITMNTLALTIPYFAENVTAPALHTVLTGITTHGAAYFAGIAILSVLGFLVQAEPFSRTHALISFRKKGDRKNQPAARKDSAAQSGDQAPVESNPSSSDSENK